MQLVSEQHNDYIFIDVIMHVDPISAGASEGATNSFYNGMFTVIFLYVSELIGIGSFLFLYS